MAHSITPIEFIATARIVLTFVLLQLVVARIYGSAPKDLVLPPRPLDYQETPLKILSWNIAMLPVLDLIGSEENRARGIGRILSQQQYDIIVFQEAFTRVARKVIHRSLSHQYPYAYGPANSGPSLRINSGLWILSRFPLSEIKEIRFGKCHGYDCISRKGAILLEGNHQGRKYRLIATHLDSNGDKQAIREAQLYEIYNKLINPFSSPDIPLIICGDFNIDRNCTDEYDNMIRILQCVDSDVKGGERITVGFPLPKKRVGGPVKPRQLDYIFTKNPGLIEHVERNINTFRNFGNLDGRILSDHYAIEAIIRFSMAGVTVPSSN